MSEHPCKGRSKAQREAFEQIAVSSDYAPHPKTLKALMEAGLVIKAGVRTLGRDRFGAIEIPVYAVPLHHFHQWCEWCDENISDDEMA